MKCLRTEEYVQQLSSGKDIIVLHESLKKHVDDGLGPYGRTMCDRIIRACNQQLGSGPLDSTHQERLVDLVELAIQGYELVEESGMQNNPCYLEKIVFHILQKVASLRAHGPASRLGRLMYRRLKRLSAETDDFQVLVRNCFAVLWNNLQSNNASGSALSPRDRLQYQLQALMFRLLEQESNSTSKVPLFVEEVVAEFESSKSLTHENVTFLITELQNLSLVPTINLCSEQVFAQMLPMLPVKCEILFKVTKLLCKSINFSEEASGLIRGAVEGVKGHGVLRSALSLADRAVQLQSCFGSGKECGKAFTECARILRGLPSVMSGSECHALFEACQLVIWAVEAGQSKGMNIATLLTSFSFLEEYQELLLRQQKCSFSQKVQYSLCFSFYQGFISTYDSLHASQVSAGDSLDRVLLYCQATAGRMLTELRTLNNDNFLLKGVCAVNNVVYELFNTKLYDGAFGLAVIVCQELCKDCPPSLPVDRVNRCFMLTVQCSRRGGQPERALDWIARWIQVLGKRVLDHLAEPVSLWVKTKCDAARAGEDDTRLRTLRDGLAEVSMDEEVVICLLEEELRLYKEQTGDTAQERYNTLCDLLDICHEDTSYKLRRASYLCEMSQVVCYQDFSQQTECSAIDFTHEALRLLEAEPETAENADRLKDEKAHASLWLYICTLESNLQEAVDMEKRLRAVQAESKMEVCVDPVPTNDLEYEDKQKSQESQLVYDGLRFNLLAHSKLSEPLDKSLSLWRSLLKGSLPAVRDPKLTASSITLMSALNTLMGKHLQALEGYQLAAALFLILGDSQNSANARCLSARILLYLGSPQLAQVELGKAEQSLTSDPSSEGMSVISMTAMLQRAQICYTLGQVESGVCCLMEVIKESARHHSKSWYLLRARALQTASEYLSLDSETLDSQLRQSIIQHGLKTPDTAQYEGLKLLCSLVMMLLGNGFYGAPGPNTDTRFVDQGDSVVFKWLLLSEVLVCSERMVAVRSSSGAVHEAKAQCLEALKLATKLQTLSHCAELLVLKAELELMKGATEASGLDLEQVRNLLDLCTDFGQAQQPKIEVKIKPRKGRPVAPASSGDILEEDEDLSGLLSSRALLKEPVETMSRLGSQGASPPLKPKRQRWLSCLTHAETCFSPCCTELSVVRVSIHWALIQADLQSDQELSCRLRQCARKRCLSVMTKLQSSLADLVSPNISTKRCLSVLQAELGRMHLASVLQLLRTGEKGKSAALWEEIEAGLKAVKPKGAMTPELGPIRAALLGAKAVACCLALAIKKQCTPEELFSSVWGWKPTKTKTQLKPQKTESRHKAKSPASDKPLSEGNVKSQSDKKMEQESRKTKESSLASKKPKDSVPKITISKASMVFKTPKPTRTSRPKSVSTTTGVGDLRAFDFTNEVPEISVNFTPSLTPAGNRGNTKSKVAPKGSFEVYKDSSPVEVKPLLVPAAPKRTKRSRFKVEFSDESDTETAPTAVVEKTEKKRNASNSKTTRTLKSSANSNPSDTKVPVEPETPRRTRGTKKSTALPSSGCLSSEEDATVAQQTRPRRGRAKKSQSSEVTDEPERMRMIKEHEDEVLLNISLEELRDSDTEMKDTGSPDADCEVLRRDLPTDVGQEGFSELRRAGQNGPGAHTPLSHAHTALADLSVEAIQSYLRFSWLLFHHFPPPSLYPHICSLLAQSLGQTDPVTTAMLHAQSLGVSTRHHMTRHVVSQFRKLKKSSNDVTEGLSALKLEESSGVTQTQKLSTLEKIFSFSSSHPTEFPQTHCQQFTEQLKDLPAGITVCMLSLVGVYPDEIGTTILLTRLQRDSAPITVRIPTTDRERSVAVLLMEMDGVLKGQKEVSGVAEKSQWWEGRKALDARVEKLLEEMEEALGVWRTLLLPFNSDPELEIQIKRFQQALKGTKITQEILKVVLSASPLLSLPDLQSLVDGSGLQDKDFLRLLQGVVAELRGREEPQGHTVLILDKYMQKLPWENITCLKSRCVTRMPSLHAVLGHSHLKEMDSSCALSSGVNPKQVYYVLNPDGNLPDTETRFKDWFTGERGWQGVCGIAPDPDKLQEAVATKDLYIYIGHGAGARFLDAQRVLKGPVRAAALLFGCSSAALSILGNQEGTGIILSYLTAGCPLVLGNLWDVTDRDLDRFTSALLQSWLSAGPGSSLLQHLAQSRNATHLKHIIGAAPIAYGLPVYIH
ncbi:separin [Triplophysa dalaica]|uniref:separin n=1 Tax=Triplophysa dalaica TaxID=1582913 RepID=UPI0024DFDE7D|nr:separin [Triplophysa dalaica]